MVKKVYPKELCFFCGAFPCVCIKPPKKVKSRPEKKGDK